MFPSQLLIYLFWTLLMAQLGYLHLTKAFIRCCNSFWKSSGLVQTVLALWVSVHMTLYLADRLWCLSHCRYWSLWVVLWYTVMERELSASGVTKVSRKGMAPFSWLPSTVNLIAGSMLLICSRNPCSWACFWVTKLLSTYINQCLGGWRQIRELLSQNVPCTDCNYGAYCRSHSQSFNLLIEFILKGEVSIMQTDPQKFNDVLYW